MNKPSKTSHIFLCLYGALLITLPAFGQQDVRELTLEEMLDVQVQGASRFQQSLSEAPAAVHVISAQEIRRYGYRNLGEALESAPGVYVTEDRDYTYLGVRGFNRPGDYNSRILLLADGLRRNEPLYEQAMVGSESPLDIDWIKQIEFVPGAASSLYGGNAMLGIVNAVLWTGADLDGSRLNLQAGNRGMARASMMTGQGSDGKDWITGLSIGSSQGESFYYREYDVPGVSDGVAHNIDGERYLKAFSKLTLGEWQFNAGYLSRYKSVPTAYYGTLFNTPGNYSNDTMLYADLLRNWNQGSGLTHSAILSAGQYQFTGQYVYPGQVARDHAQSSWLRARYQGVYEGLASHKIVFGASADTYPRLEQGYASVSPHVVYLASNRSAHRTGFYVQDAWQINSRWSTNLGVRVDHASDFAAMSSPRAALIYSPAPDTWLKLIHGRSFRPPNNYERFYNDGNLSQKSNPDLLPERLASDELTLEFPLTSRLRVGGSIYRNHIKHLISEVTDPIDGLQVFTNGNDIHSRGLELEAEAVTEAGISLRGSMAWQHTHAEGQDFVNSPHRLAKLMVDGPIPGGDWSFGLKLQAISARESLISPVAGYLTGNLTFSHPLPGNSGQLRLGFYNLGGLHAKDPAPLIMTQDALPRPGRLLLVSVEFHL